MKKWDWGMLYWDDICSKDFNVLPKNKQVIFEIPNFNQVERPIFCRVTGKSGFKAIVESNISWNFKICFDIAPYQKGVWKVKFVEMLWSLLIFILKGRTFIGGKLSIWNEHMWFVSF